MTDSSKDELEKIRKLRAELESKLANAERDRKALEEGMQILREKAVVRELEDKLREEQDAIASLRIEKKELDKSRSTKEVATSGAIQKSGAKINVGELEDKLKSTKEFATSGAIQKSGAEMKAKIDKLETDEQTRVIWKKDEEHPINWKDSGQKPESDKTLEEQKKKKKRRFF